MGNDKWDMVGTPGTTCSVDTHFCDIVDREFCSMLTSILLFYPQQLSYNTNYRNRSVRRECVKEVTYMTLLGIWIKRRHGFFYFFKKSIFVRLGQCRHGS